MSDASRSGVKFLQRFVSRLAVRDANERTRRMPPQSMRDIPRGMSEAGLLTELLVQ